MSVKEREKRNSERKRKKEESNKQLKRMSLKGKKKMVMMMILDYQPSLTHPLSLLSLSSISILYNSLLSSFPVSLIFSFLSLPLPQLAFFLFLSPFLYFKFHSLTISSSFSHKMEQKKYRARVQASGG